MKNFKFTSKVTTQHITAAVIGNVRSGATIQQIVKTLGISCLDVEAIIITQKLSVKPN